jgi:putative component of toxin-antitoxin plasmid stabilization module
MYTFLRTEEFDAWLRALRDQAAKAMAKDLEDLR